MVRIVKMTFRENEVSTFLNLFKERKEKIRNFPGCRHLELWQDEQSPNIFFTYSIWQDVEHLNHYRFSDFFKDTWSMTKSLFEAKAEAWTLNSLETMG